MKATYFIQNCETGLLIPVSSNIALKNMYEEYPHFRGIFNSLEDGDRFKRLCKYNSEEIAELTNIKNNIGYSHAYILVRGEASDLHKKITRKLSDTELMKRGYSKNDVYYIRNNIKVDWL